MSQNTKIALLRAAERLIAERGLGGISVKQITRASGSKNESALHYHFGSVDKLLKEVFASRFQEIEDKRVELLAKRDWKVAGDEIDQALYAAIAPYMAVCLQEGGRLYASFCAQLATDPRFDLGEIAREMGMDSLNTIRDLIRPHLSHIPQAALTTRARRALSITLVLVADYAKQIKQGNAAPLEEATTEVVATVAGFIRAPIRLE
ncbi:MULTISPECIES: TetR/AcrR family transcriptional regulator [Hyphobacterium]|uniref:TetR/AcrR family transcriptional regulator n=1 Tax=Hyphobacterium vulgare TaxID=1736751 RepID=A0ABV7A0T6_9PROT